MASVNKVILIGNLGRDPEMRFTPAGKPVTNFTIATTDRWTDKNGQKQERTEWHRIVFWGRQAEVANQYLKKGSSCYVEGRLTTRSWEDKDKVKRYSTEIEGLTLQLLSSSGGGGSRGDYAQPPVDDYFDSRPDPVEQRSSGGSEPDIGGDDLPF